MLSEHPALPPPLAPGPLQDYRTRGGAFPAQTIRCSLPVKNGFLARQRLRAVSRVTVHTRRAIPIVPLEVLMAARALALVSAVLALCLVAGARAGALEVEMYRGGFASVNSFIFSNGKTQIVMDVQRKSYEADRFIEQVKAKKLPLTHILITHGHTDHFTGMARFRQAFPEARIVVATNGGKQSNASCVRFIGLAVERHCSLHKAQCRCGVAFNLIHRCCGEQWLRGIGVEFVAPQVGGSSLFRAIGLFEQATEMEVPFRAVRVTGECLAKSRLRLNETAVLIVASSLLG